MLKYIVAACLFASTAQAIEVDMTIPIHDIAGQPWLDPTGAQRGADGQPQCTPATCPPMTIGKTLNRFLSHDYADEPNVPFDQKWARAALGARIESDAHANLNTQEVALLERLIGHGEPWLVIQLLRALDPDRPVPTVK